MPSNQDGRLPAWNRHFVALAMFSFLILFSGLHRGDLSGYDDALYAHEAKQMLLSGDWWTVRFNGTPNFEYPPLFMWLEALSMQVLGFTDFAAKLPVALLGLGTIIITYFIAFELTRDAWFSLIAMFILLSTQYFMKYSTHAMTDVPCAFFFLLAVLAYTKGLRNPNYFLVSGLAVGFAVLTRSVVGLIPLIIFVMHLLVIRRFDRLLSWQSFAGVFLAVLIPSIWYVSQYHHHGESFVLGHFAFIKNKISSDPLTVGQRALGLLEYPKLFLRHYWPWLPFALIGLAKQTRKFLSADIFASLIILWVLWIIVPFSLAQVKILRYLMAVFPALALLAAGPFNDWFSTQRKHQLFRVLYGLGAGAVLFMFFFPGTLLRARDMKQLAPLAEAHSAPFERVVIYTGGRLEYNYNNQFLWYANRYSELLTNLDEVKARFEVGKHAVAIMDVASFQEFVKRSTTRIHVLGQSERFICFQTTANP